MTTINDRGSLVVNHVVGDRGRLTVHLAAAELRVAAVAGERVVVRTPDGRALPDRVVIETTDGGVTIREKESGGLGFTVGHRVVQLEIDVPPTAEVAVATASGWLDAIGLIGEQRYRAISGDIRLRDAAGMIELTTVSGEATIELTGATDLAIKSVSGDARVSGGHLDALRIATTSGDIQVDSPLVGRSNKIETLSGDVDIATSAGIRVEARTVSGDLMSDLPHRSEGRMGRRTLIVGDGSIELTFRSVSGDLRIHDAAGRSTGAVPPVPPVPPLPHRGPETPFSVELPELPELPEMPEMPSFGSIHLPDLDLGGFASDARRDDPLPSPTVPANTDETSDAADPIETERMEILRALEQGDLDVAAALDRLAALDGAADGRTGEAAHD